MSRMSDLHIEIQEMLSAGHTPEWIGYILNVPCSAVEDIQRTLEEIE
jgi:hypothetical protein